MYAVIDVETTGGSPAVDRITEIAIVLFDGEKIVRQFSSLINPLRKIDKYVTQLTGISDRMVKDAPTFADLAAEIDALTRDCIFVAHNVKFDYGLVRSEFKRVGIDFVRKQIDTVTLAQKVLPGFSSYSLGTLCQSLGIVVENRHRALGDAQATTKVFDLILKQASAKKYIEIELNQGIDPAVLPPQISMGEIEKLPEEPGVLYLKDAADTLLLIEPTRNVRKEAIKFLNKAANNPAKQEAYAIITQIDFVATGHELIAKLMAYEEVKKTQPPFNKKLREPRYTHGLFIEEDEEGFNHLRVMKLSDTALSPKMSFPSKYTANKILMNIISSSHLQVLFNLLKKMNDPDQRRNFKVAYNEKIERAVRGFLYKHDNFFIIADGRRPDENSVVWVADCVYRGFGFIAPELTPMTTENLQACISPKTDDNETQKIIRQDLRKAKGLRILGY